MWPDQHLDHVKLADDPDGQHFGLFANGQLVSVISLFGQGSAAQFRKSATEPTEQGKGHGSRLLGHLVEAAQQMGVQLLWCNARTSATLLYEKFGFVAVSGSFWQHGTEYVRMERIF